MISNLHLCRDDVTFILIFHLYFVCYSLMSVFLVLFYFFKEVSRAPSHLKTKTLFGPHHQVLTRVDQMPIGHLVKTVLIPDPTEVQKYKELFVSPYELATALKQHFLDMANLPRDTPVFFTGNFSGDSQQLLYEKEPMDAFLNHRQYGANTADERVRRLFSVEERHRWEESHLFQLRENTEREKIQLGIIYFFFYCAVS